jgi:chemotaxis methyl-accepting protein methylase
MVELEPEHLERLSKRLHRQNKLQLASYRDGCIKRRLSARIRDRGLSSLSEYLTLLDKDPGEEKKLIDALTVSLTSFFRDADTFNLIRKEVAPELARAHLESGRQRELRIWSAACSTGEEAYSLAIIFLEGLLGLRFRIRATDIDEQAIAEARKGFYPAERLKNMDPRLLSKYFTKTESGWQVWGGLKEMIDFRIENLLTPGGSGFEEMDMVVCRNFLIYLEKEEQIRILGDFDRSLRDNGYLVLGKTEYLFEPYRGRFEHISPSDRIYRKQAGSGLSAKSGGGI